MQVVFHVLEIDRNVVGDLPGKEILLVVPVFDRPPARTDFCPAVITAAGALLPRTQARDLNFLLYKLTAILILCFQLDKRI